MVIVLQNSYLHISHFIQIIISLSIYLFAPHIIAIILISFRWTLIDKKFKIYIIFNKPFCC